MKLLVAIALLVLAVAGANHDFEHTLRGPRFEPGKLYKYDLELNVTATILGLSTQSSAAVFKGDLNIFAKTEKDLILQVNRIFVSDSVKSIDSKDGDIYLHSNRDLFDRLNQPIKFTFEDGKVTSYTLSNKENLESRKIKKSILRSFEMHVPESTLLELETYKNLNIPVTYNTTEETEFGHHISQYMVTSSPNPDFPSDRYVYNISRIENFEAERYPAHKLHHNFQKQGCPEVCRKDWKKNEYGAGCPTGYEAHQSPMKISFGHEHHLSRAGNVLNPEIIRTVEVHIAKMYDQDMEVLFRYQLTRRQTTEGRIEEMTGQKIYTDLHDWEHEINEKEIEDYCSQKTEKDYLRSAGNLLSEIAKLIVEGDLDKSESNRIGEKVILLQDALSKLNATQLRSLANNIQSPRTLQTSSDEEKVKRQILLNILPTVGTTECVKFIADLITEGKLMKWEMKEILEALPQNIQKPNEEVIRALNALTEKVALYSHHLHSAVYLSLARVIGKACGNIPIVRSQPKERSSWLSKLRAAPEKEPSYDTVKCPVNLVHEIIKDVIYKLKCAHKPEEIVIYIETLAHIGTREVIPVLTEYVYGTAENLKELSEKHIDFLKTVTQFALHNIAGKYPEEVLKIVLPVYFNETETPRVRNAALGVTIRCQPSLDVLQKLAMHSWFERSYEVGSYLTSTLETFGNSSLPCMQLTARRIKAVLPQFRRFDIGAHHSKNYFWNYFDDHREFGLEKRFELIRSNESVIPSVFYKSLSYSLHSLKDVVVQTSLNGEGLTPETIIRAINYHFGIENIPTIPNEAEVFGEGEKGMEFIKPRIPEDLRFTVYGKMFYQSSYFYLDSSTLPLALSDFQEVVEKYLKTSSSMVSGYFVKLMVPSSYHSVSVAKTVPYPVEFQMKQPIIFALKVKNLDRRLPTRGHFNLHLRPSVYLSKLFTHQVKNLGDCKEVGTYHEHKVAASYNFEIKYDRETFPNATIKYKVPQSHKKFLTYFTESGTYAGKKGTERLPSTIEREPIKTLPTPYKFDQTLKIIGLPSLRVQLTTEDTTIFKLPRNPTEALHMAVKKILNAGWRHKSVNITFVDDHTFWKKDTEVNFKIRYLQQHVPSFSSFMKSPQDEGENWSGGPQSQRQTKLDPFSPNGDIDWAKIIDPDEPENKMDIPDMTEKAKHVSRILNYMLPHMNHLLNISVVTYPEGNTAYFQMDYNHTYDERLHTLRVDTAAKMRGEKKAYEMSLDHVMGFWATPSEFTYDSGYGKQEAFFVTALGLPRGGGSCCRWEKVNVAAMGHLKYVPNKEILKDDLLVSNTDDDYFMPEKHRQCYNDVRQGRPMSNDCVKAIQELSIYNRLNMFIAWEKVLPKSLRQFFRRSDIYLKHVFYDHLHITEEENTEKLIAVKMDYIDKLVEEPAIDLKIRKPTETVMLHRLPAKGVLPLSSVYSMFETLFLKTTNNSHIPTCSVSENYIKTFDLKTYPFSPEECHYVVTAHCTQRKNFAVIMKGTKEIHLHVGANRLILTPRTRTGKYVVQFNGDQREVTDMMVLVPEEDIYAYTVNYEGHQYLTVVAKKAGIKLTYEKWILKIVVDPIYRGELCGLCSEFDSEELREFRGMDRCLYESHLDFARSAMVKREGQCRVDQPKGRVLCDGDDHPRFWSRGTTKQEEYEPRTRRNIVITKGREMCFSVHAVPVCEGDDAPNETETQLIGFHCLPKHDVTAKRLENEAKWRPLEELEKKSVDYEDSVEVAKMC